MFILLRVAFVKSYSEDIEVEVNDYVRLQIDDEYGKTFRLLKVSENKITLEQNNDRVLLQNEPVNLFLDGYYISGVIEKSTNGKAVLEINDISNEAYLRLINLYSDSLRPHYDLDEILELENYMEDIVEGEVEYWA